MQAVILAAGMGRRLKELTQDRAKCMVPVNQVPMIERMLRQLEPFSLTRVVAVIGHKGAELKEFIGSLHLHTPVEFVENPIYESTNNIYSLYLAKEYLTMDDTLLLESDLIFEKEVLAQIVEDPYPNLALVARFESWMDGTVVLLDEKDTITKFLTRKDFRFEDIPSYYKTVNIYKFSREFSATHYVPFLEAYSKALGNNEYYEQVLKVISLLDDHGLKASRLESGFWYEIDDEQDLDIAESIFTDSRHRLSRIKERYGGYWRYPRLLDFCYLVNPYFPNERLLGEIKANFERLVMDYPSGLEVNNLLAAKSLGLKKEQVLVGNGAAELIKALMETIGGPVGLMNPSFEEYINRVDEAVIYDTAAQDFRYSAQDVMDYFQNKEIRALVLINPDNPSGNYLSREEVLALADYCERRKILLIADESFVDFADAEDHPTLLDSRVLEAHPGLAVIKSASKSFGVPGFRLGILACGSRELLSRLKEKLPIWNINSFGEYFLQIFEKYRGDYEDALTRFYQARREFYELLKPLKQLRTLPSQANYIMCELLDGCSATQLAELLLNRYDILIKDLSQKKGVHGHQFIRIAIKKPEENKILADALKCILR